MHQECEFPSLPGFKRSSGAWKKHFCDGAEASLRFRLARRCFYLTYRVVIQDKRCRQEDVIDFGGANLTPEANAAGAAALPYINE